MADSLKSVSITALDIMTASAGPIQAVSAGEGAAAFDKSQEDYVTPTTDGLASTASLYKLIRLPFNAKVKALYLSADSALDTGGSPSLALDVGAYYSDSTVDGTPAALQGTLISANCFAAAITFGAATNAQNVWALSAFSVVDRNEYLWSALGLSSNPGGFVDVVVAVHTAAETAASHNLGLRAEFVQG